MDQAFFIPSIYKSLICYLAINLLAGDAFSLEVPTIPYEGSPTAVHYSRADFQSDEQFWTMTQDPEGYLYFGNNQGVLIHDGEHWQMVQLPNGSSVRSLMCSKNGKVYVGGYNEFGYLEKNAFGQHEFTSLTYLLRSEDSNFDDIWQIVEIDHYVVFRSFKQLMAYNGSSITTVPSKGKILQIQNINERLIMADHQGLKLLDLSTLEYEPVIAAEQYQMGQVCAILPGNQPDQLILFSKEGNSYVISISQKSLIQQFNHLLAGSNDQVYCAIKAGNGHFYIGKVNSKMSSFKLGEDGISEEMNYQNLQNNTVLGIFQSQDGNIWALLNKGIDCIQVASPKRTMFEGAAVYDALHYKGQLYIATNQGVYRRSGNDFELLTGLQAQTWSLEVINDYLVISHDRGVYVSDGVSFSHVEGTNGIWKVIPAADHPNQWLACGYDGIYVLKYRNNTFNLSHKVQGFDISARDILPDKESGIYWICHGYKGVYRVKVDHQLKEALAYELYTDQNGLPSTYGNNVTMWNDQVIFITTAGAYQFNSPDGTFTPLEPLNAVLGDQHQISTLKDANGITWFVQNGTLGYFNPSDASPNLHKNTFLSLKGTFLSGMEFIEPYANNKLMVGTTEGLFFYDLNKKVSAQTAQTKITAITSLTEQDSLMRFPLAGTHPQLPNDFRALKFHFATPAFAGQKQLQYRYKLQNLDESWSEWQSRSILSYNYLPAGSYVLQGQSRDHNGNMAAPVSYQFRVLPVWYRTRLAMVIYFMLSMALIGVVALMVRRKITRARQETQKIKDVLELEIKNMKLLREKENIEADFIHKSKELSNYTILLFKKRELLNQLASDLKELRKKIKLEENRELVRSMTQQINRNLQDEEHLKVFDINFESVHREFFSELKTQYPELSQKDLRLCGLVKMNFSNKEIASILNISVRGVETARYRLRKRMSINKDVNMAEFLEQLSSGQSEEAVDQK